METVFNLNDGGKDMNRRSEILVLWAYVCVCVYVRERERERERAGAGVSPNSKPALFIKPRFSRSLGCDVA